MSKKISNRIFDCAIELDQLAKARSDKQRKFLLKRAKDCVIDSISEIALNCLKGNVPIKNCDFKKLRRYKSILRKISSPSPCYKRRKILVQKGGFLPILLNTALGFLGSLAVDYLKKKIERK